MFAKHSPEFWASRPSNDNLIVFDNLLISEFQYETLENLNHTH